MATVGGSFLGWADYCKQIGADGKIMNIIDTISAENAIIEDMYVVPGNTDTGLRTTVSASEPTVALRGMVDGYTISNGADKQLDVTAGTFSTLGAIPESLVKLAADPGTFRVNHNKKHIAALGKRVAQEFFYGNLTSNPNGFNGLCQFYSASTATDYGTYVLKTGAGGGGDNTSLWLIDWGPDNVCAFSPKNTQAGIQHRGNDKPTDEKQSDGTVLPVYYDFFDWYMGIAVRDFRKIVRISNIDVSDLATANAATDSAPRLLNYMIEAKNLIPNLSSNAVFYGNRNVLTAFDKMLISSTHSNMHLSQVELVNGKKATAFFGIPIRLCEAILNNESAVA